MYVHIRASFAIWVNTLVSWLCARWSLQNMPITENQWKQFFFFVCVCVVCLHLTRTLCGEQRRREKVFIYFGVPVPRLRILRLNHKSILIDWRWWLVSVGNPFAQECNNCTEWLNYSYNRLMEPEGREACWILRCEKGCYQEHWKQEKGQEKCNTILYEIIRVFF